MCLKIGVGLHSFLQQQLHWLQEPVQRDKDKSKRPVLAARPLHPTLRQLTAAAALANTASSSCLAPRPCTTVPVVKEQCSQDILRQRWLSWSWNQNVNRFVSLHTFAPLPCFWPDLPNLARLNSLRPQQGPEEGIWILSSSHGPSSPLCQAWAAGWQLQYLQMLYAPWRILLGWLTQAAHNMLLSRSQSLCGQKLAGHAAWHWSCNDSLCPWSLKTVGFHDTENRPDPALTLLRWSRNPTLKGSGPSRQPLR